MKKKVFIDSDVVISSLISKTGAAHYLVNNLNLELWVSNKSVEELIRVSKRLGINDKDLKNLLSNRFSEIKLAAIKQELEQYTLDPNDIHIVAGAKKARAKFLVSYNIRHFKIDKIAEDLKIVVLTPARFLQYLRSIQ